VHNLFVKLTHAKAALASGIRRRPKGTGSWRIDRSNYLRP